MFISIRILTGSYIYIVNFNYELEVSVKVNLRRFKTYELFNQASLSSSIKKSGKSSLKATNLLHFSNSK